MTKYRNKPIVVDGERFDSQAEYSRWRLLDMHQKEGRITNLQRQVPFVLAPSVQIAGKGRKSPPLRYVADFVYQNANGEAVVEDVKGSITEGYRIKRHLLAVQGIQITEIKA